MNRAMWSPRIVNVARLKCLLTILGIVLQSGFCQNAEPKVGSGNWKTVKKTTSEHRYSEGELTTISTVGSTETEKQPFNWAGFSSGEQQEEEEGAFDDERDHSDGNGAVRAEITPQARSNKDEEAKDPEDSTSALASPSGRTHSSQPVDSAASATTSRRRGRGRSRRPIRRFREEISRADETNSTDSRPVGVSDRNDGSETELNDIEGSTRDKSIEDRGKMWSRKKSSKVNVGREKKLREARERRKKIRTERRRRRYRERKRKSRVQDGQRRKTRKGRKSRRYETAPAAMSLQKSSDLRSNGTRKKSEGVSGVVAAASRIDIGHDFASNRRRNQTSVKSSSVQMMEKFTGIRPGDEAFASGSNHEKDSSVAIPGDEKGGRNFSSDQKKFNEQRDRSNNVEREFSKQFERELSKSRHSIAEFPEPRDFHLNSRIGEIARGENEPRRFDEKFENSRFAGEKILGYSRSENELPSDDANNEVYSKISNSYEDYIANALRLSKLPISQLNPLIRDDDEIRKTNFPDNSNTSSHESNIPTPTQQKHPFENFLKKVADFTEHRDTLGDTLSKNSRTSAERDEQLDTDATSTDEENLKGDLSCINGTFLPAPLVRHALIKYVKSSIPGHEYLEADYDCTPGYSLAGPAQRLLCHDRRWVGKMPKCKLRQTLNNICADASCEQVCTEVNGTPYCSCYKGFRQQGNKCIDINECQNNNGGCEFICLNTPGSYRCECPKGMREGENRYTCMDINECLLNNGHGPCQDTCENFEGGYRCSCKGLPGTTLGPNNHTCRDAGPCGSNNAGCSHTCLSTMGRIFCLCPDGFMLEDDWKTCQDVDECAVPDLQTTVCQHGCINTPGSYRCAEPPEMKDQPRLEPIATPCNPGREISATGDCVDVDECAMANGGCHEVCENTDGSFFCACNGDEKLLAADGKTCVDINDVACPALNPSGRGYVMCSRLTTPKPWRGKKRAINRPGTKCFLRCPYGYQLRGEYELTCGSNGSWIGSKHGECVRYSKPRLDCPEDIVAEVPPGQSEAFVTYAQPSTDLDWFRYVRSEPSWGTRLEANLTPGQYKVTFVAKHPVSKKQATCSLRINVKRGEAPRIKNCPDNIVVTGHNGTVVNWTDPIFTDNVKVVHVTSKESPGHAFPVGVHKIQYEASDAAGWTATCDFLVTITSD